MSTTPETVEQKIVAKEAEVELVKRQLQDASGDRELLLQQQLTALRQELAPLRQEKVLLMQQQAGAAGSTFLTTYSQLLFKQACSNHGEQHFPATSSATACTHNMPLCFHVASFFV